MLDIKLPEIKFALESVRQAANLVKQVQAEMVSPALTKEDRSPVTVADFASQALVGQMLMDAFPNDPFIAEEDSTVLREPGSSNNLEIIAQFVHRFVPESNPEAVCTWIDHGQATSGERYWTLDPIDGTKGFLRGDQYVAALALVIGGQVEVAVLGCPNLVASRQADKAGAGSLVVAARSQGAWTTPLDTPGVFERLQVSNQANPSHARILRSFESGHTNTGQVDAFAQTLGVQASPVRLDSQAKYALLAAGEGELYLRLLSPSKPDYRERIWDQAAGSLILSEAGGRITDLHGKELDFTAGRTLAHNRGILASNTLLHEAALGALRDIGA